MVDLPDKQGYKFNLTKITYDHDGCQTAKVRVVHTKFRDDPMAKAEPYDTLMIKGSEMNTLEEEREITLGTVGELNGLIGDDPAHRVVVEATLQ